MSVRKAMCAVVCLTVVGLLGVLVSGCSSGGSAEGTGTVRMYLTDAAAADIQEVHVHITSIQVMSCDEGAVEVLGDADIPDDIELVSLAGDPYDLGMGAILAGEYCQVRLILSDEEGANWVLLAPEPGQTEGERHDVKIPSAYQSGIKLITGPFEVGDTEGVTLLLDFDAAASVHQAGGSGQWMMRPVIHVSEVETVQCMGSVTGTVTDGENPIQPPQGEVLGVFVLNADDEVVAVAEVSPDDGTFEIPTLLCGEYDIELHYATEGDWDSYGDALSFVVEGGDADTTITVEHDQVLDLTIVVAG